MSDLVIREPGVHEIGRAAYLFRQGLLRPQSRILVAVRSLPVERFVAAAAWWDEGSFARFHLTGQPGGDGAEAFGQLTNRVAEIVQQAGMHRLQYADLLTEAEAVCQVLQKNGFSPIGAANRFFEVRYRDAWERVTRLFAEYKALLPLGWRTDSILQHAPETAWNLIGQHGLLPPTELRQYWLGGLPLGFERDVSSILFDGAQPIGVMLVRGDQDTYFVDVRVVQVGNRKLRALGNILLFQHMAVRCPPKGRIQRLQFHGSESQHRETANLALRMGGHEMPSRYLYAKKCGVN